MLCHGLTWVVMRRRVWVGVAPFLIAGLLTGGYTFHGGSYTDAFLAKGTCGHYLFECFTAEAGI